MKDPAVRQRDLDARKRAAYVAERDAWVDEQLAKPEAQGPLPKRAEQVLAGLTANRPRKKPA